MTEFVYLKLMVSMMTGMNVNLELAFHRLKAGDNLLADEYYKKACDIAREMRPIIEEFTGREYNELLNELRNETFTS